jgi:hypothetical protein
MHKGACLSKFAAALGCLAAALASISITSIAKERPQQVVRVGVYAHEIANRKVGN